MTPLGPWPAERGVAVGVSGGADSLCLALLLRDWAGPERPPLAFIVDHGLRAESRREAALTTETLSGLGIRSKVLRLEVRDGSGLQARARAQRHAALAEACAHAGLPDLLLGHHRDDQDETIAMRARASSGPHGLSGMSSVSERNGLRIVRPFLPVRSERLRATLRLSRVAWVEDPSNADLRFERVRLRSEKMYRKDRWGRVDWRAEAAWLARHVTIHEAGFASLAPGPIPAACLSRLLQAISGRVHPPGRAEVRRLAAQPVPATLHGVRLIQAGRLGPGLLVCRERASMSGPIPIKNNMVWDGRFALKSEVPDGWQMGAYQGPALRQSHLPGAVKATLAALYDANGILRAVPHAGVNDPSREIRVIFSPALPAAQSFFTDEPHRAA